MTSSNQIPAKVLLERLLQRRMLELEGDSDPSQLEAGVSQVLGTEADSRQRATQLAQWLMGQQSVAELYATDEELASLIEQPA